MRRLAIALLAGLLLLSGCKATKSASSVDKTEQPPKEIYIPADQTGRTGQVLPRLLEETGDDPTKRFKR
jgi:ABC-type glycerol-3-phosphate transport system substrate-binding protein